MFRPGFRRIQPRGRHNGGKGRATRSDRRGSDHTISHIGAFLTPFAWGVLAHATGSFDAGLLGIALMMVNAALIWVLRTAVRGQARRAVPATA